VIRATLDDVHDALEDIAADASRNSKLEKLEKYLGKVPWLEETIEYALNPYKHYKTTSVELINIDKCPDTECFTCSGQPGSIFDQLDYLSEQKGASDSDKMLLSHLSSLSEKTVNVVNRIVKKDLRCGVQVTTANKFMNIPVYKVMKAEGDSSFPGKNWEKFVELCGGYGDIISSIKVDGYRVSYATVYRNGEVEYLSTSGRPYDNFSVFDDEMIELAHFAHEESGVEYPMRFDAECVSSDGNFQTMQKHARRQSNIDSEVYRLLVWDVICPFGYMHRYGLLDSLVTTTGERYNFLDTISSYPNKKVFRLEHKFYYYRNVNDVISHAREIISAGNEGLLFKTPDHIHEFKRSAHWFKLKGLYLKGCGIEVDLPVIGFEYGKKGTRLEKVLGAFICEYKGNKVRVSGKLSDDQRIEYAENLPSFIEVNADSETDDGSLRLPIFQRARVDK